MTFPSPRDDHSPSRLRLRPVTVLAAIPSALLLVRLLPAADQKSTSPKPQGVYELRQDGYVEKIDPNVDYKDRMPRIPTMEVGTGQFRPEFANKFWAEALGIDVAACAASDSA